MPGKSFGKALVLSAVLLFCAEGLLRPAAPPTSQSVNLNAYYRFPLSMGVEYQRPHSLRGLREGLQHLPHAGLLPPAAARLPAASADCPAELRPVRRPRGAKWSHQLYAASLGLGLAERFSKNFELGAEALAGGGEAVYPPLDPSGPLGSPTLLFEAGGCISLDPSYGLSVDVQPDRTYLMSLSPLTDFDGLSFGLGFSVHYRFGEDPDAAPDR